MKLSWRTWLLLIVFVGGFLGRAIVYSHGSLGVECAHHLTYVKKARDDKEFSRRVDGFGISKIFVSFVATAFAQSVTFYRPLNAAKPQPVFPPPLLQPPC